MSKRDISEKVAQMISELGDSVLQDQRVATELLLVQKTYAALEALIDLHNDLDPSEQIVWSQKA